MSAKLLQIFVGYYLVILPHLLFIPLPCTIGDTSPKENTFDFIIVGGGTSGLVLSRRLAEAQNKKFTVLVLESGEEPREDSEIPAYAPRFLANPDLTFRYKSLPQRNAGLQRSKDGVLTTISGKGLGGTSNLNWMVYNRASPRDYDAWAHLTQDPSWNYSNMLKYFKRAETYQGGYPSDQHGYSGPLTISRSNYAPGLNYWLEAGKQLGYEIADPNGPQKISFSAIEFTKKMGRRVSSFSGYVEPILSSGPNLRIATNTDVTKILFDGNRAIGVRFQTTSPFLQNMTDNIVYARKEIILSAGAYGSAILLLRSGIGPSDSLNEANIPVIKDLPVGASYQDHVSMFLPFVVNSSDLVMDYDQDLNPDNFELYKASGQGPYSCTGGVTGQAFLASSVAKSEGEGDWADLQFIMAHNKQVYFNTGLVAPDSVGNWEGPMAGNVFLTRPKSIGSLRLDPKDPNGPPLIDVGYLSDPRDFQRMKEGIYEMLRVFEETPAYKSVGGRFPRNLILPGCSDLEFRSGKFWDCYIRHMAEIGYHPAGSCRMGREGSADAVVDTKLRVIGIEGLRVVDASIMPVLVNANTQAAVYGIAEKASDMILQDWE